MKILITGGAGFVGSHVAEYYAKKKEDEVIVFDNLSRAKLLGYEASNAMYNWNYLKRYDNIELVKGDIRDAEKIKEAAKDVDVIIHTAAQTAVTTSLENPRTDFEINALGTFNVLEAAKLGKNNPCVIFCSTNKVYGDNVNNIPVQEKERRYELGDEKYLKGIPEDFPTDLCEHTPYGCSKFTGDIYVQDYAQRNEIDAAVFRMSCIYGTRQFGVEDQGWVAWFTIATLMNKPITIYGDGKQVRDVLYISDLVRAYDAFVQRRNEIHHDIYNIGGGSENTMSLLELLDILKDLTDKRSAITFGNWRPSDQKVYISDITKAKRELGWKTEVNPKEGVEKLVEWMEENKRLFK
jgi:CDP-paratose 2-epimerase